MVLFVSLSDTLIPVSVVLKKSMKLDKNTAVAMQKIEIPINILKQTNFINLSFNFEVPSSISDLKKTYSVSSFWVGLFTLKYLKNIFCSQIVVKSAIFIDRTLI